MRMLLLVEVAEVTFKYKALQNKITKSYRGVMLSANKHVFSPFLNCPGVRSEDCSTIVLLLFESFCRQVVTGFLELGRCRWLTLLADGVQE